VSVKTSFTCDRCGVEASIDHLLNIDPPTWPPRGWAKIGLTAVAPLGSLIQLNAIACPSCLSAVAAAISADGGNFIEKFHKVTAEGIEREKVFDSLRAPSAGEASS